MELNLSQQKNPNNWAPKKQNKFTQIWKNKKSRYILIVILLLIAVSGSAFAFMNLSKNKESQTANEDSLSDTPGKTKNGEKKPESKPTTTQSPINGIVMQNKDFDAIKNRPVLGVMIQNNIESRPEYGLNEADLVYEAVVEGGITRFMGVYWSEGAEQVRSIRSARKYYVDLLGEYNNPVYMHEGYASGDPEVSAIDAIYNNGVRSLGLQGTALLRDLDCQAYRAIEHCAYTTTDILWEQAAQNDWTGDASKITPWIFKNPGDAVKFAGGDLTDFTINFQGYADPTYSVNWKYDSNTKKYNRYNLDGTPYTTDGNTEQVVKDVVIYQKVGLRDSSDGIHVIQDMIGDGTGYIMQDGKVYNIIWKKSGYNSRTKFFDAASGEEFVFNRGKIWVTIVGNSFDFVNNTPPATNPS